MVRAKEYFCGVLSIDCREIDTARRNSSIGSNGPSADYPSSKKDRHRLINDKVVDDNIISQNIHAVVSVQ